MGESLKIWHIVSNRWYSAITSYGIQAAHALHNLGHDCLVTCLDGTPGLYQAHKKPFRTNAVSSFGFAGYIDLLKTHRSFRPDLILTYGGPETAWLHLIPGKYKAVRFIGQSGDLERLKGLKALSHFHLDGFLTPSAKYQAGFAQRYKCPVAYIPYGVQSEVYQYHSDVRKQEKKKKNRITLLLVGRLDPVKGHHFAFQLLKQWSGLPQGTRHPIFLKIVGEEANLSARELEASAQKLGLLSGKDFEVVTKRLTDLPLEMSRADLGLIPSLGSEVICRVGAEFLMCGTPILCSDVGSLAELLFEGAGRLIEPQSGKAMLEFIQESAVESEANREERAKRASSLYSLACMGSALESYLLDIMAAT